MKKISLLLSIFILTIFSCKNENSLDYLTVSGTLSNTLESDSILNITTNQGSLIKKIKVSKGVFKDTLKVETPQIFTIQLGQKRAPLFLRNGYNLNLIGDSNDFMKSFKYSGEGSSSNNFVLAQIEETQKLGNPAELFALDSLDYIKEVDNIKTGFLKIREQYKEVDSILITQADQQFKQITNYLDNNYSAQHANAKIQLEAAKKTAKGMPSPTFKNYLNARGGKKSLKDFKGKYVYIDVWATWCGPCIREIPSLQALEKAYKGKKIEFVSMSTDEPRRTGGSWEAAEKIWKKFVKDRNMSGVQIWAGKDISFQQAYMINSIPRFILLNKKGEIIDANAPRPSDPRLKEVFNQLDI